MKKLPLAAALIIAVISVGTQAGVKEKKTLKNAQATADAAAETVTKACGNESLGFVFDWKAFEGYDYKTADKYHTMKLFGDGTKEIGNILAKLCADPDYKEEVAKLTEVHIGANQKLTAVITDTSFTLDGTTLNLVLNGSGAIQYHHRKGIKEAF